MSEKTVRSTVPARDADVVIVGGGIMGLLLARTLLQAGRRVIVLEAGQCGREASWAGGGIVSPLYPWRYPAAVTALASQAQAAFPRLCSELHDETGIDPEWCRSGLLMLDPPDRAEALAWASAQQVVMEPVDAAGVRAREPGLAEGFADGLWMPRIAQVRNPRLLQALQVSVARFAHGAVHEFTPVSGVRHRDGAVEVVTARRHYRAAQVVVCAGAWSALLLQQAGVSLPVEPVLGQMLLYRMPPGTLGSMVLHEGRYAIPRQDGHILVGSTLEYRGFDKTTTHEAAELLQAAAGRLLPALRTVRPVRQWAGLRPGSPGGVPVMGAVPGWQGLFVCAGHFRNGLVLSPASAQFMADCLLGAAPAVDPLPYALP